MTHENRQAARELIPTRESLLSRLRAWDDQVSWQAFFDTYGALIFSTAIKAGLSAEEAQDVVQETVIAAARSLPKFHYDPAKGSFKGWLLTLTRWRIVAEVRKRQKNISMPWSDACNESPPVEQVSDPAGDPLEALWDAEW
jgi:RNA polymerase sigma-70 factor (ECF subfamily)